MLSKDDDVGKGENINREIAWNSLFLKISKFIFWSWMLGLTNELLPLAYEYVWGVTIGYTEQFCKNTEQFNLNIIRY